MMQKHENQETQNLTDNFLEELKRCEKIFKTRRCLEILPPTENRKSRVDDVNFQRIADGVVKKMALMNRIDSKLSEMRISLKAANSLNDDMNLKYEIPK